QPSLMSALTASIADAGAAQAAALTGDASALRPATAALRTATRAVVEAAVAALNASGASGEGQRDEAGDLIRQFGAAHATAQLEAGLVGTAPIEPGMAAPPARPASLAPRAKKTAEGSAPDAVTPPAGPSPFEVRAAERARRQLEERRTRLTAKLRAAEETL